MLAVATPFGTSWRTVCRLAVMIKNLRCIPLPCKILGVMNSYKALMKYFQLPFLVVALAGCTTEGYQLARSGCYAEADLLYPKKIQTRIINVQVPVQVPTGNFNCQTMRMPGGLSETSCQQKTRTEYRSEQQEVTEDINEKTRIEYSHYCAQKKCIQTHGNVECKK